MFTWLAHALGLYEGEMYNLWSGVLPDVTLAGGVGLWYRKHNCMEPHCYRLQWHPHPEHGRIVCRRHHPDH